MRIAQAVAGQERADMRLPIARGTATEGTGTHGTGIREAEQPDALQGNPRSRDPRSRDPRSRDPRSRDPRSRDPRSREHRGSRIREALLRGTVTRRLVVNFRVSPELLEATLPPGLTLRRQGGHAIAGICVTRMEERRFLSLPFRTSECLVHRIAVADAGANRRELVTRCETTSLFDWIASGRGAGEEVAAVPCEHVRSRIEVDEADDRVMVTVRAGSGSVSLRLEGRPAERLPRGSVFGSLARAARFFDLPAESSASAIGDREALLAGEPPAPSPPMPTVPIVNEEAGSATPPPRDAVGRRPARERWVAHPLEIEWLESAHDLGRGRFPAAAAAPEGAFVLDHALVLRNVDAYWHAAPDLHGGRLSF